MPRLSFAQAGEQSARLSSDSSEASTARAKSRYEMGVRFFEQNDYLQALVEFEAVYAVQPRPAVLFMVAQCEFLLGRFKQARSHYEEYLRENPNAEYAKTSRDRIASIDNRPSTLVINTDPESVDVKIEGPRGIFTGQAPSQFPVPPGRYRVTLSKANHERQTVDVALELASTQSIFRKLDPTPARLEITTRPAHARLFVNGNLARNPYRQLVAPGRYEIFVEPSESPPEHDPLAEPIVLTLGPGQRRILDSDHEGPITLEYKQRNGKAELVAMSTIMGMAAGFGMVSAYLKESLDDTKASLATGTLIGAGVLFGGGAGLVASSIAVPDYIPDKQALFVMGGMWIGAAEGALIGMTYRRETRPIFIGGALGLMAGGAGTIAMREKAPSYGRVFFLHSAAAVGLLSASLLWTALDQSAEGSAENRRRAAWRAPVMLGGLNLGIAAGLSYAYLYRPETYGWTWKRVALVDLAGATGALFGLVAALLGECQPDTKCEQPDASSTAAFALSGGIVGLATGAFLTRNVGREESQAPAKVTRRQLVPVPVALPVQTSTGQTLVPGLAAAGRF